MITATVPAYRAPILALIAFPLRYTREAAAAAAAAFVVVASRAVVGSLPVVASIAPGYPQPLLIP